MKQAITYKDIDLSLGKVISIENLCIKQSPNCHGELSLSAILDSVKDNMAFYDMPEKITVTYHQKGRQRILFKGLIRESSMERVGEYMEVRLTAHDATCILDTERKTRSFQNISRTSHSVIEEIMEGYSGGICIKNIPNQKIGQIWFQYEETDWEFLCRFASHYGERLYADATYKNARFQAGVSSEKITADWESHPYQIGKDLKQYAYLSQNGFSDLDPNAFLQYEVESYDLYTLGSMLSYKGGEWFIASLTRDLREGILVCAYTLKKQSAMLALKEYNRRITGISIDGRVVQVQRDKVRVSLNVDDTTEQGTYWFPFSTVAASSDGSGWYSMPEKGDSIRVYFPTRDEKEGYVITKHDSYTPALATGGADWSDGGSMGGIGASAGDSLPDGDGSSDGSLGGGPSEESGTFGMGSWSGNSGASGSWTNATPGAGYDQKDAASGLSGYRQEALKATGTADAASSAKAGKEEKENPLDDPDKRNIFTQDGNMVRLAPTGVFLSAGTARVSLYKNGAIAFYAPGGITLDAGEEVNIDGSKVTLEAKNRIALYNKEKTNVKITKTGITLSGKEIYEN